MNIHKWMILFLIVFVIPAVPVSSQPAPQYTITGHIYDDAESAVPGAFVCARRESPEREGGWICVPADQNGRFVISVNTKGQYIIRPQSVPVRPNPNLIMPSDIYPAFRGMEVVLNDSVPDAQVDLKMPKKNGVFLVTAVDIKSRRPIEFVTVQVCPEEVLLRCGGLFFRSDTGEYTIHVPPYPFNMSFRAPGHKEWVQWSSEENVVAAETSKDLIIEMVPLPDSPVTAMNDGDDNLSTLPAPKQLAPVENARFVGYPRTTTLEWEKVDGAASYAVEVDFCQNSQNLYECRNPAPWVFWAGEHIKSPRTNTTTDTTFTFDFVGAQPGRWRVWAIDRKGREGFKSPWRIFIYAR